MKKNCEHSTLKTDSEDDATPVILTDIASNANDAIAEMENFVVNNFIMKEATKIVQSMLETASEEEI